MTLFNAWRQNQMNTEVSASARAVGTWNRIQRQPTPIVLHIKGASTNKRTEQTVRVEMLSRASERADANAINRTQQVDCIVFGVLDHPSDDVADTVIARDDTFGIAGVSYRVLDVRVYPGEIQADCVRQS